MSESAAGRKTKTVRKRLADGTIKEYSYDLEAIARRKKADAERRGILYLASLYYASPEFARLSDDWRRAFRNYVTLANDELGWMTLDDLAEKKSRMKFYALRDLHAATPAKADKLMTVLGTLLSWAYNRNHLDYNHAVGIDRLVPSTQTRAECIWSVDQQVALCTKGGDDLAEAFRLAYYTLIREDDLCGLRWDQFDGHWLVYRPSKTAQSTGVVVHLPVYRLKPLRELVAGLSRCTDYMLTTAAGHPWTASNLSKRFNKARAEAGLAGADRTWHDIRGTGETQLYLAGCTDAEVASISGHAMGDRAQQRSYLARVRGLAEHAYDKWDRYIRGGGEVLKLVRN